MTAHTDPIGRASGARLHPKTHEVLHRDTRAQVYASEEGYQVVAEVPGWYPDSDGEAIHTPDDDKAKVLAAAALKALENGFEPATHATEPVDPTAGS